MKTRPTPPLTDARRAALEARFAMRLTSRLDDGAQALPHDITERLRVAREQAVRAARESRLGLSAAGEQAIATAGGHTVTGVSAQGTAVLGGWNEAEHARQPSHGRNLDDGPVAWRWRIASALPIVALAAGLWLVHSFHSQEKVEAAADIDTAILSDDLPPDAYADPGFEEFLRSDDRTPARPLDEPIPEADGDLVTTDTEPAEVTP